MAIKIGCAPSCWGVDDVNNPYLPPWQQVLEEASRAGYRGIELGPYGYLPLDAGKVFEEFKKNDLTVTVGTIFADIVSSNQHDILLKQVKDICELITKLPAAPSELGQHFPTPYLTYMDYFHKERSNYSGHQDRVPSLTAEMRKSMLRNITDFCKLAWEDYGVRPVLHPHAGGYVEFENEFTDLLEDLPSELSGLVLDTGHLYYSGVNPAKTLIKYAERLDYVHFKDINRNIYEQVMNIPQIDFFDACAKGVMCPIGTGDIDYAAIRDALHQIKYSGWVTIEQERDPRSAGSSLEDVSRSFNFVNRFGL